MVDLHCTLHTDKNQKEITRHGSVLFPVACYEDDMACTGVPIHWHDEFEYILAFNGTIHLHVGTEPITLRQGAGILINAGLLHSVSHSLRKPSILRSLVVHPDLIAGSPQSCYWQELVLPFYGRQNLPFLLMEGNEPWHATIAHLMMHAWDAITQETEAYTIEARYVLSKALHILCQNLPSSPIPISRDVSLLERMKLLLQYIEQHYAETISNQTLMRLAACSESVLLRSFKKTVGTSPMNYLQNYRIQQASSLLLSTDMTSSEIAIVTGFHDISYFTKIFHRTTGLAPQRFRAAHRTK